MKFATVALVALNVGLMIAVLAQLRRLNDRLDVLARRRTARRRRPSVRS
ncbi:MAG: hypothetical protein M1516_00785 [Firmicutes bacterium]|nr:hypothetical protein [Bacillota bacterium]